MKQSHRCGVGCHWCDRKGCSWNENMFGKISSNWILARSVLYIFSSHVREDNTKNFAKARSVKQKFFASSLTIEPGFYLRRLSEKWYKWPPLIPPEFDAEQQKNGWLFRTGAMRSIRIFRNKFWRSLQTCCWKRVLCTAVCRVLEPEPSVEPGHLAGAGVVTLALLRLRFRLRLQVKF